MSEEACCPGCAEESIRQRVTEEIADALAARFGDIPPFERGQIAALAGSIAARVLSDA